MAVTVGTNAYTDATAYTAYATERGITITSGTLDADLILSADFIGTYYNLADEYKLPITGSSYLDAIEKAALKAVELQQAGRMTIDFAAIAGGVVKRSKQKADVLEEETEYQDGTTPTIKPRVPELDVLMRPFLAGGSFGKKLV